MYRTIVLRILESYFRHRWLNLLPFLAMVVAAGIYMGVRKADYVSQGVLYINSQSLLTSLSDTSNSNTSWWISPSQGTTDEINELIKTDAFVRAIIQRTDLEQRMSEGPVAVSQLFQDVRTKITVLSLGNNQTEISVSDSDPRIAYQLVNSLTENYIQWKMNSQKTESQAALDFFSNLIKQYKTEVDASRDSVKAYISAHPEPIQGSRPFQEQFEIDRLNSQVKLSEERYTSALEKEENAKLALQQVESNARQTYITIDAPEIPVKPTMSLKSLAMNLGMFLVVGIMLSGVLIVGGFMLDKTIRFTADATLQIGLPVLAMIPDTTSRSTALSGKKHKKDRLMLSESKQISSMPSEKEDNEGAEQNVD